MFLCRSTVVPHRRDQTKRANHAGSNAHRLVWHLHSNLQYVCPHILLKLLYVHDLYRTMNMRTRVADFRRRYDQLSWNILKLMNSDPDPEARLSGHLDWALVDRREWAGGPPRGDDGCPHMPQNNANPGW